MIKLLESLAPNVAVIGVYSFVGEIKHVIYDLRWMFVFIVMLIFADFILGIIDSIVR